ncbi:methanogen output domain 1-containing protein [Minwuia thermotolerans]|uniref:Transcriptional regulator n=1 Tax=Minwuia thermotolerans TaxID=2056226 RepID=A0A2M9FWS9_9PROT|nr:methanogen output domain 1-containing protein [Minwuia thermotolerans]PJK27912.1 transcriptional regulator [Minwuia thermotolerans]
MNRDGTAKESGATGVARADIPLERDVFLRSLLRELAGTLEEVVGLEDASGYISIVGGAIGRQINDDYSRALGVERLSREQVGEVLVDLKRRIQGGFHILEMTGDRIVLGNDRCPFGVHVEGRPSLCMMTSNVFGYIAAENTGYAHVTIEEAIARGDAGCRVVIDLKPQDEPGDGREYFGGDL